MLPLAAAGHRLTLEEDDVRQAAEHQLDTATSRVLTRFFLFLGMIVLLPFAVNVCWNFSCIFRTVNAVLTPVLGRDKVYVRSLPLRAC